MIYLITHILEVHDFYPTQRVLKYALNRTFNK